MQAAVLRPCGELDAAEGAAVGALDLPRRTSGRAAWLGPAATERQRRGADRHPRDNATRSHSRAASGAEDEFFGCCNHVDPLLCDGDGDEGWLEVEDLDFGLAVAAARPRSP